MALWGSPAEVSAFFSPLEIRKWRWSKFESLGIYQETFVHKAHCIVFFYFVSFSSTDSILCTLTQNSFPVSQCLTSKFTKFLSVFIRWDQGRTTQSEKRGGGLARVGGAKRAAIVTRSHICHTIAMTGGGDRIDSGDDHAGLDRLRALWSRSPRTTVTICTR